MAIFYLNGEFVPQEEARVGVLDLGLLRGYGVFEFLRTYSGKFFLLDKHLERFWNSAHTIDLDLPLSKRELKTVLKELIKRNGFESAAVRLVLTGGTSPDGFTKSENDPNFFIVAHRLHPLSERLYKQGVKLITLEHERIYPRAKTLSYTKAFANHSRRDGAEAYEIVYTKSGKIYEAATANFFLVKGTTLITAEKDILLGLTRGVVLDLAKEWFKIEKRKPLVGELEEADEAFITSTNKEVLPVVQVEETVIGSGSPGLRTKKIMEMFRDFVGDYFADPVTLEMEGKASRRLSFTHNA